MVKDEQTVISCVGLLLSCMITDLLNKPREFNELVNMSASGLDEWLEGEESASSGWSKDDGSGETIGHER